MIKGLYKWYYEWDHMTCPRKIFWCTTSYLKYQPSYKLHNRSLDIISLLKWQCVIYGLEILIHRPYILRISHVTKLMKSFPSFIRQRISQCKFQFYIMSRNLQTVCSNERIKFEHGQTFFICSSNVPRPNSHHYWGNNVAQPIAKHSVRVKFQPEGHRESRSETGLLTPIIRQVGFELKTLRFDHKALNHQATLPFASRCFRL